jgi:hypothetical protein
MRKSDNGNSLLRRTIFKSVEFLNSSFGPPTADHSSFHRDSQPETKIPNYKHQITNKSQTSIINDQNIPYSCITWMHVSIQQSSPTSACLLRHSFGVSGYN